MILTCPSCGTQYVVKDGAIPPQGRQVRCASCKHSWHQDAEPAEAAEIAGTAEPDSATSEDESLAEAALIEPRSGPEAEERAYEEALVDSAPEPEAPPSQEFAPRPVHHEGEPMGAAQPTLEDELPAPVPVPEALATDWQAAADDGGDDFSPFAADDEEAAPSRRGRTLGLLLVVLAVAALAAAFWFLAPPEWKARVGLGSAGASPLAFVIDHRERQPLESGNELLTISGRIVNPTAAEQSVPPIKAELRTAAGKLIYSWMISPPTDRLAPGASASFNSAMVNVPAGGDHVTITTAPNG